MTEQELNELTGLVYQSVTGLSLAEADVALDEARRTLWGTTFSGRPIPDAWEGPSPAIARALVHLPLDLAAQVLEETRLSIWLEGFPNARPNLFGRLLDSAKELQ
ncbi:MAG: hypothetical protein U1E42_07875 [Rhodospirillales bacterium]